MFKAITMSRLEQYDIAVPVKFPTTKFELKKIWWKKELLKSNCWKKCGFEFLQAVTILLCCLVLEIGTRVHRVVVVVVVVVVPLWVGGLRDIGGVQRVAHHVARRRIFAGFPSWHLFQERNQFNSNLIQREMLKN